MAGKEIITMNPIVKEYLMDALDKYKASKRKKNEIKKFEDCRRKEIYEKVQLTDTQKKEIDEFYMTNYGEKIPYTWHRHYTAFTGKFDVKYFPELLFIPEFERFMNPYEAYAEVYSDKNLLPWIAKSVGVKMPNTVMSCASGMLRDQHSMPITSAHACDILNHCGKVFAKPSVDTCSGQGCMALEFKDGIDISSGKTYKEIFTELGRDFVVQERIVCHESISRIYANSVNTFRVMTYRWKDEIKHAPVIMRIGKGGACVDNAHAGGIFVAIDDDGRMHESAFTEFKCEFKEHPDTKVVFSEQKLPLISSVLDSATKMHCAMPQIGVINWDFTVDEVGEPVLIEANINGGSIWLFEMAHGKGAFGEDTAEILQWMGKVKKLTPSERVEHYFGE